MSLLIFFIVLSISVSFLCSVLEAVILSVTPSYLAALENRKPKLFKKVYSLKEDIEKPLASILTFNTIAHTIGAAGAGAEAQRLFGSEILAAFSAALTFAILFFSEIIPKSIGASSWKILLPFSAQVLKPMIIISYPLVWLSEKVSSFFKGPRETISRDEIAAMADIGLNDGALNHSEHRALKSLIKFAKVKPEDILIPKERVQSIKRQFTLEQAYNAIQSHPYSRILVEDSEDDKLVGYLLRAKLQQAYIKQSHKTVEPLILPIMKLSHITPLPRLFQNLLQRREHICAILDQDEKFLGIITLEDLIEHMLDLEIYDEMDHLNP